jgi:hypothetical protein
VSGIAPVVLDEIIGLDRYETIRGDVRARIIELKRYRRVSVGEEVTFVFENHDTVFFQIQEMLRAEHIVDLDATREELAVYNELLPRPGELSATMLIEIVEQDQIESRLKAMIGIDEAVRMDVGAEYRIPATFEAGRSREDRLSAVQYVRCAFPRAARELCSQPECRSSWSSIIRTTAPARRLQGRPARRLPRLRGAVCD